MKYFYKNEIKNKKEWESAFREAYGNKADAPWEIGYSGERLAEDFINTFPSSGEQSMVEMIRFFMGQDSVISMNRAEIEHFSKFDYHRHPRQQDLGIWGKVNNLPFFIGVEAKVNEAFGNTDLARQSVEASKTQSNNDRFNKLIADFLVNYKPHEYNGLRYQLLHYLAGSLREPNCNIIFMPVIVYTKNSVYNEQDGMTNKKAYEDFMNLLFNKVEVPLDNEIKLAYKQVFTTWNLDRTELIKKQVYSCYIQK